MYFTRLSNKEMFPAQEAMGELEKIVKSNLGQRISQEAGLPEHWYEDASKNMWTGHLGLWTRHFREIDEQLATLMDPRVSIAQSLERIAHALEDSSEPRYRGALASLPGALERQ